MQEGYGDNIMKKILIIHPYGNMTNNPSLSSIVELLNGYYEISVLQPKMANIYQEIKWKNVYPIFYETNMLCFLKSLRTKKGINKLIRDDYSLVIGIDEGIEYAEILAKKIGVPFGLISYEILFPKTYRNRIYKEKERNACKNVAFAICQDSMRSYILSIVNNVPIEKIINIPISELYKGPYKKSNYLKHKLNIPGDKKIVLYIGSVADWTLASELIKATTNWPEPWVLVIHPRYGIDRYAKSLIERIDNSPKVYLSSEPVHQTEELEKIVCSADFGLALYSCDFSNKYIGENILFVGLASGKLATYLKYGVPVIVNNDTNIAEIVANYGLGKIVMNVEEMSLDGFDDVFLEQTQNRCTDFFLKYLNFSLYKDAVLQLIQGVIDGEDITDIINQNNQLIDLKTFDSMRMFKVCKNVLHNTTQHNTTLISLNAILVKRVNSYIVLNYINSYKFLMWAINFAYKKEWSDEYRNIFR
jgi:hypothetical protein